jgi:hypothetical protein
MRASTGTRLKNQTPECRLPPRTPGAGRSLPAAANKLVLARSRKRDHQRLTAGIRGSPIERDADPDSRFKAPGAYGRLTWLVFYSARDPTKKNFAAFSAID